MYHTAPRVAGENMPLKLGLPKIVPNWCLILSKIGTCNETPQKLFGIRFLVIQQMKRRKKKIRRLYDSCKELYALSYACLI